VSRYEGLPKFRGLTLSPSSGCAGTTKPPAHPEDEDGVSFRNVENLHIMALLSTRELLSPRKLQDLIFDHLFL